MEGEERTCVAKVLIQCNRNQWRLGVSKLYRTLHISFKSIYLKRQRTLLSFSLYFSCIAWVICFTFLYCIGEEWFLKFLKGGKEKPRCMCLGFRACNSQKALLRRGKWACIDCGAHTGDSLCECVDWWLHLKSVQNPKCTRQTKFFIVYFLNAIKVGYSLHIFHNLKKIFINFFLIFTGG